LTTGLLAFCVSAAALAGDVYQWKDAHGVTQYSSTPPPKGTYKVRQMRGDQVAEPTAAAQPAENPACVIARNNMETLKSKAEVQIDSDGDGKADKTLSEADKANQIQLAQATLKVNCAEAPADKPAVAGN
jgi:hypothetical protein